MGRSRVQRLDELGEIFGVGREIEVLAVIRPWGAPIISLRVGAASGKAVPCNGSVSAVRLQGI